MIYSIVLSILLIILQVIDIVITEMNIKRGAVELNPIIRRAGYWVKVPSILICIAIGIFIHWAFLILANALVLGVCIWNYIVFRKLNELH